MNAIVLVAVPVPKSVAKIHLFADTVNHELISITLLTDKVFAGNFIVPNVVVALVVTVPPTSELRRYESAGLIVPRPDGKAIFVPFPL